MSRLAHLALALLIACGSGKHGIAELKKADGPVERQEQQAPWAGAAIGTQFFLGDAARTGDGAAQLEITGAMIAMQPHTILRFGGSGEQSKISVELGAVDLTGNGNYGLDIGDVKLSKNGTVRITAHGKGEAETVDLTVGEAQLIKPGGQTIDLIVGNAVELGGAPPIDAGVVVPLDAAAPVATVGDVAVEIVGKKAELQDPGSALWKPLAAGAGQLAKGAKLRLGAGTTAKLTSGALALELASGARAAYGEGLALEAGSAKALGEGTVAIPGGTATVKADAQGPGETRLEVGGRETKVSVGKGKAKLTGGAGAELEMNRGEVATLAAKGGAIHPVEAIPSYFDFRVSVGESLTVHDPRPPSAIQFVFDGKCPGGNGVIELDRDGRFTSSKQSAGKDTANLAVQGGGWAYRLRCGEGGAVALGRIVVTRDDGSRRLPKITPENPIDADGRNYTLSYQSQIPTLVVKYPGTGGSFKLHVASGGKEDTFEGSSPIIKVPGTKLHEGTFTYWFDHDGVKQPKVSQLKIDFDNTAPQVYIESPTNGQPWTGDIRVAGAVLPMWTAAVEATSIPIDKQRRFNVTVGAPTGNALAIRLSHPQRGTHYYLRRQK